MNVAESGLSSRWIRASSTSEPAVSAKAASSCIEVSAFSRVPWVQTPMSTTRSSRSCRYSTSVTSCSSVDSPPTRRRARRSSRSCCRPSDPDPTRSSSSSGNVPSLSVMVPSGLHALQPRANQIRAARTTSGRTPSRPPRTAASRARRARWRRGWSTRERRAGRSAVRRPLAGR